MLDICHKVDVDKKIKYIWFDTGIEYQATKDHLNYLEEKYKINIIRERAKTTVAAAVRQYGQPFLSKNVSKKINGLQRHGFKWEEAPLEELLPKYCKWSEKQNGWRGCSDGLKWWSNAWEYGNGSLSTRFNIGWNKWLKEFMVENPPNFKISDRCCQYAKKDLIHNLIKEKKCDMNIVGVRKAEGGVRATAYKSCFDEKEGFVANYRPLFFWKNEDKDLYVKFYSILHSDCYTKYGFIRTGCAACPYGGKSLSHTLEMLEKYEPKLYQGVTNIFKESYEYTKQYREFVKKMKEGE